MYRLWRADIQGRNIRVITEVKAHMDRKRQPAPSPFGLPADSDVLLSCLLLSLKCSSTVFLPPHQHPTCSVPSPLQWEKLQMTASERRKIMCSVTFHVIAITCVVWSLYVLIDRTADEIRQGQPTSHLVFICGTRPSCWM